MCRYGDKSYPVRRTYFVINVVLWLKKIMACDVLPVAMFSFFIKKNSLIILFVWLYTLFSTRCFLYHHSLNMNVFQIQIIQKMLSNLSRPVKTSYSPFQVKQSKLCHWLIVFKLNIQFIIMRTFQTSNKSNSAMSFWMIRWNLSPIKQLVEMT